MQRLPAKVQGGFSLVELMVALLLGVILTSGVISVFITSKNTYNINNAVGQVQEAGRFALTTLQPLIAAAGSGGCGHIQATSLSSYKQLLATGDSDPVYMTQYGVYGFEYVGSSGPGYTSTGVGGSYTDSTGNTPAVAASASEWSPTLPAELFAIISNASYPVVKYSDILIIHEAKSNAAPILTDLSTTHTPGALRYDNTISTSPTIATGQLAVAADCSNLTKANLTSFQITSWAPGATSGSIYHAMGTGTPGNVSTNTYFNPAGPQNLWPNTFYGPKGTLDSTDTVGPEAVYVFYIGKSSVDQGTSLFEVQLDTTPGRLGQLGTPQEIVPGVENMQFLYGIDTTGDPWDKLSPSQFKFETADAITSDTSNTAGLGSGPPYPPGSAPDGVWNEVISVRVALLVHSDNNSTENNTTVTTSGGSTQTVTNVQSQKFYMLGTGSADSFTYNSFADRRLRRLFQETISIRSQLP